MKYMLLGSGENPILPNNTITLHNLSKNVIVGPLQDLIPGCNGLNYRSSTHNRILYLGDTLAGKTRSIRSLCHALGGFVAETTESGRTIEDYNLVFAYDRRSEFIEGLELSSHAGHNPGVSRNTLDEVFSSSAYCLRSELNGYVLVYDPRKNMDQLHLVDELLKLLRNTKTNYHRSDPVPGLLLTHTDQSDRSLILGIKDYLDVELKGVAAVDNIQEEVSLAEIPWGNIEILVKQIRGKYTEQRHLIYFGNEEIPEGLKDFVVRFNDLSFSFEDFDAFIQRLHDDGKYPEIDDLWHDSFLGDSRW